MSQTARETSSAIMSKDVLPVERTATVIVASFEKIAAYYRATNFGPSGSTLYWVMMFRSRR